MKFKKLTAIVFGMMLGLGSLAANAALQTPVPNPIRYTFTFDVVTPSGLTLLSAGASASGNGMAATVDPGHPSKIKVSGLEGFPSDITISVKRVDPVNPVVTCRFNVNIENKDAFTLTKSENSTCKYYGVAATITGSGSDSPVVTFSRITAPSN